MPILALGVSYRRASVDLLERLAFGEDEYPKAYHHLLGLGGVREAAIISTCNRVEVYAEVTAYHEGFQDLKRFLSESRGVPAEEFADPLYSHYEDDAAEHLFSVAAGIDSMVLGEPQILTQVRQAFLEARDAGACGRALSPLFRSAIKVGRRARAETQIGASPTAFVEAGARLASEHLGGLEGRSLLVVGAGEMSALAVSWLRQQGIGRFRVLNRSPERAEALATPSGGAHGPLDQVEEALAEADLLVCSTGAAGVVVGRGTVERAVANGRGRLFVLDLAVPRDVDPAVRLLPGVRVADIDDLREELTEPSVGVGKAVPQVREIVEEEVGKYRTQRRAAQLAPLIAALHARGEEIRSAELRRMRSRLSRLTDREWETVEALTRGIVKTLLHDPVVRLKERWGAGVGESHARILDELFGLRSDESLEERPEHEGEEPPADER